MHAIFYPPMAAYSRGEGFHPRKTEQVIAGLARDLLLHTSLCTHHPNPLQLFPAMPCIQKCQDLRVRNGPILADLSAAMPLLHGAMRLMLSLSKMVLKSEGKRL